MGKKKKYTIIEGIKLYETVSNQKGVNLSNTPFWNKFANSNILPERTADSIKNFWKKVQYKTLEAFLIECIHEGTDFCFAFKKIPNPEFVKRFKQQYENDFIKLSALKNLEDDMEVTEKERELEKQLMLPGNLGR